MICSLHHLVRVVVVSSLIVLTGFQLLAQNPTPGTYNFDGTNAATPAGANSTSLTYNAGTPSFLTYVSNGVINVLGGTRTISYTTVASSTVLSFKKTDGVIGFPTTTSVVVQSTSGSEIKFTSMNIVLATAGAVTLTFTPSKDGVDGTAYTLAASSATAKTAATFPVVNFSNIDKVTITGFASDGISLDDVVIAAADTPPSVPTDANAGTNTVAENSSNGTTVGVTASATDPQGNAIVYSLTNSASGRFAINSSTGVVTVANGTLLNFEATTSHQITVQASDGILTSTQNFTIAVTNVNEGPVFTSGTAFSIPENTTAVTTVTSTDPESNSVTYSISGGADGAKLAITSGGVLSFVLAPDYELPTDADANNTYIVTVRGTDNGTPSQFTDQTITVTVTNTDDGFFSGYSYRKRLTLNTSTIVSGAGTLTNFPVLLQITDNDLKYTGNSCVDKVQSATGNDIAFTETDNSSTELNMQLESYDPIAGTLLVWVKIPSMVKATNKTINIYFGSPSPAAHPAGSGTWASDYIAVFHFNEASYTGTITDGTSTASTATAAGMTSSNFVTSKIGKGYSFAGAQKFTSTSATVFNTITSAYTISAWVNPSVVIGDQKFVTNQAGTQAVPGQGYKMGMSAGIPEVENRAATPYYNRPGVAGVTGTSTTLSNGTWYYVQGVYSGGTLTTYVNGVARQSLSGAANPGTGSNLLIGVGEGGAAYYFSGLMDEVRISNVGKSADWLLTEYNNQNAPASTILTTGSIEYNPAAGSTATGLVFTWKGTVSTDITNAGNWNNTTTGMLNQGPVSGKATLVIPTGLTNYPSLAADFSIAGLTVASGATVNLNGFNLNVFCNIANSGTITDANSSNSKITFNGSLDLQTYTGNAGANSGKVGRLEVNNSSSGTVTLSGGALSVSRLVTVTKGSLASNGFLTLKSTATSVSSIAPFGVGTSITGNVNVESYITGGNSTFRGSRIIASPINEAGLTTKSLAQLKNYIVITGPGGATNGFDPGGASQPYAVTLSKYNEPATNAQSQFINSPAITESLLPGTAAFLYFRGSRDGYTAGTASTSNKVNMPYADPENVTAVFTGPINQGNVTVNLSYTNHAGEDANNGYNIVGNPYAAIIDWENVTKNNVQNELKFFKPGGGYATYLNGISTNAGGLDLRYIQPAQGFYTRAIAPGASLTFTESCKSVNSTPVRLMSAPGFVSGSSIPALLRINLQDSINTDEAVTVFEKNRSDNAGKEDAAFFGGSSVSLSTLSQDNKKLAINYMQELVDEKQLLLSVSTVATANVKLNFTDLAAAAGYDVVLRDNYLNKTIEIKSKSSYAFKIDKAVAATFGENRFVLTFKKKEVVLTKIEEVAKEQMAMIVYPNPADEEVFINHQPEEKVILSISDLLGRTIKSRLIGPGEKVGERVSDLGKGVYIVKLTNQKDGLNLFSSKFIKK